MEGFHYHLYTSLAGFEFEAFIQNVLVAYLSLGSCLFMFRMLR